MGPSCPVPRSALGFRYFGGSGMEGVADPPFGGPSASYLFGVNGPDFDSGPYRVGVAILGIWLLHMLARLRFQVLYVDADNNWA